MDRPQSPLTVAQAAARQGKSRFAIHRWLTAGLPTPAGRLRLKAEKNGGTWAINPADLDAFVSELTRRSLPPGPADVADAGRAPEAVRRRARAERAELAKLGI